MGDTSRYKILNLLADSQTNTRVYAALDTVTNENVAIKMFSRNEDDFLPIEEEIRIQEFASHPNIAPIQDIVYDKDNIYVVMKLYAQGDLFGLLKQNVTTRSLVHIYSCIVDAVLYLHERGIAHLDIKPENIFIDEDFNPVLADFGCCETKESRKRSYQPRGTIIYAAPEVMDMNVEDHRPMDIWSLGILLYLMLTKHLPWKKGNDEEILQQVLTGDIGPTCKLPKMYESIVKDCCKKNPKERMTIQELRCCLDAMNPPAFVAYNYQKRHSSAELMKKYQFQRQVVVRPKLSENNCLAHMHSLDKNLNFLKKSSIFQQSVLAPKRKPIGHKNCL